MSSMSSPTNPTAPGQEQRRVGPNRQQARLLHMFNPVLTAIVRSPLHRLLGNWLTLIEFSGRTSGKRYSIPVGYQREGNVVSFHTGVRWWKNLRGNAPIRLWLDGRPVDSTAEVVTDAQEVARVLAAELRRAPRLAGFYNVRLEPDGLPNHEDLAQLARDTVVIKVPIPAGLADLRELGESQDESRDDGRDESMRGKIVMVTGANAGIGKATALALAKQGATVVMVSRNRARGEMAAEEVIARSGNASVELLVADLSSQDSVRRLARDFLARYERLDVLVNNAGVYMPRRQRTADGLETMFATNYLAQVLLTNLLLPALKAAAPARIVNVASGAQAMGRIDFADLQGEKRYRGMRAYAQSKLALIIWTYELARRLSGTGVAVNALEPGIVATKLPGRISPLVALIRPFMTTPEQGARSSVLLASSPRAASYTGNYFSSKGVPIRSRHQSYDRRVAQRLWDETARLVGVPAELVVAPVRA